MAGAGRQRYGVGSQKETLPSEDEADNQKTQASGAQAGPRGADYKAIDRIDGIQTSNFTDDLLEPSTR
jgi:hypothetical protein